MTKEEQDVDWFVTGSGLQGLGVADHAGKNQLSLKCTEVREDWSLVNGEVFELVSTAEATSSESSLRLEELSVELGFNAMGKLGFSALFVPGVVRGGVDREFDFKAQRGLCMLNRIIEPGASPSV